MEPTYKLEQKLNTDAFGECEVVAIYKLDSHKDFMAVSPFAYGLKVEGSIYVIEEKDIILCH